MNKETNNEMDLLLRRLGRQAEPGVSNDGNHLDADELNAYAENSLPAAARARYTAHLAECSPCRQLVAQLSSAAGVANVVESTIAPQPSALRKFLASLLSPMVLRYAVPALGLIVVAAIGFVILRNNPASRSEYVTQVTNQPASSPTPEASVDSRGLNQYDERKGATPAQPAAHPEAGKNKQATPAPPPPNQPMTVNVEVRQKEAAASRPADQPAGAGAAAAPAPTPTPASTAEAAAPATVAQNEAPPPKKPETDREKVTVRADEKSTADFRVAEAQKRAPTTASRTQGLATLKRPESELSKDDGSQTRSVAGRRFRKRDGVWIDTAYDSSKEAMTLTRGSERYRSIIADEPQLKTIADELDGEIIVVWKGHTYRIR